MHDDYYRGGGGVVSAFLLGGIVGAALGLLFAPRSGRETRQMISTKANDYWDQGLDVYETGRERVADVYETGRERVAEVYDSGRQMAVERGTEIREKIDVAREKIKGQVDEIAATAKTKVAEMSSSAHKGNDTGEGKAKEATDKAADAEQTTLEGGQI